MAEFAPELIPEILEWLYYTPIGYVDQISLTNRCLVTHSWRSITQQLLFRGSPIPSQDMGPSKASGPGYSYCLHRLSPSLLLETALQKMAHVLPQPIRPRAHHAEYVILSFDPVTISLLSSTSPPIKALRISNAKQCITLYQHLAIFPYIRHLVLHFELGVESSFSGAGHSILQ